MSCPFVRIHRKLRRTKISDTRRSTRGALTLELDMDRGVFIGGGLICASFLLAVLLNESARDTARAPATQKGIELEDPSARCDPALAPEASPDVRKPSSTEVAPEKAECSAF